MNIDEIYSYLEADLKKVEKLLLEESRSEVELVTNVTHYVIESGGKRIRPALLILSAKLCGFEGQEAVHMAAVMEFTHTATLLHDDVVDGAQVRRGIPSSNNVWNNAISVLAGDYLLSLGINLVVQNRNPRILDILSRAACQMSEGEIFQYAKAGDIKVKEEDYLKIVTAKTALLFSASCEIGAVLANASPDQINAMAGYGLDLGRAFQLIDDYLDYLSLESELGKIIGKDLEEGKITLPLIYALKKCNQKEKEFIEKVVLAKELSNKNLESILKIIKYYGGEKYTKQRADDFVNQALSQLEIFSDSKPKEVLTSLAQFITSRNR